MQFQNTLEFARNLDQQDSLARFRNEFHFPKNQNIFQSCSRVSPLGGLSIAKPISSENIIFFNISSSDYFSSSLLPPTE